MIKHVVCFKLKDSSEAACKEAQSVLLGMKGNVPLLRDIYVGIDFLHSERSYDVILEVLLDDRDALEAYQGSVPLRSGQNLYAPRAFGECCDRLRTVNRREKRFRSYDRNLFIMRKFP